MSPRELRDWAILAGAVILCSLALLLTGCSSTRTEQTRTVVGPLVVDTPVGPITSRPIEIRQQTHEKTETELVVPPAVADAGGGLLALVPGVGGILAAGWAVLGRNKAMGALKACADGIEKFKGEADSKQIDHLHGCLSKSMDASHKAIVRKVKA